MITGLSGFKGSGKSVVAGYLEREHGFVRVNFKDALVEHMKEDLPDTLKALALIHSMTIDELFVNKPIGMRELMQNYGTDIIRKRLGEDYWVNEYTKTIGLMPGKNIVTDDVRFQNEFDKVNDIGGVCLLIKRTDITTGGTHKSETEHLDFNFDFVIEAEPGGHQDVYRQVESILQDIKVE